jgi:predicted HAD superfamily Cof-like phosphohydrolase
MRTDTNFEKVVNFSTTSGPDKPYKYNSEYDLMKMGLIQEEYEEVRKAFMQETLSQSSSEALLKELVDLLYVTYGYANYRGWNIDVAFNRVHASNMSKLGDDGKPILRDDGKVMKSTNYKPADLKDLV